METPPPSSAVVADRRRKLLYLSIIIGGFAAVIVGLFASRLLRVYRIPTAAMQPAIMAGDRVVVEGVTYLFREPRVGEIVAFRADDFVGTAKGQVFVKRLAGRGGDRLQIKEGKLYVNGNQLPLTNVAGEIVYSNPPLGLCSDPNSTFVVPRGKYFMLGDNSAQSMDSRNYGPVPAKSVLGRIVGRK